MRETAERFAMSAERLRQAREDAHRDAFPFAAVDLVALLLLAFLSYTHDWELLGTKAWWLWLVVALPLLALTVRFGMGIGEMESESGRAFSIWLLRLLGLGNAVGVFALVASLTGVGHQPTGGQLLTSGFVVLLTNVVTFAFAFWELDNGGPVARAMANERKTPDFQFPQDDNPSNARAGWEPRLWDYAYVALTNATAFSPTDAMPLTRPAKLVMAIESTISITTVLIVAARAVNVLK